ncbi:MAG: 3D domain-containing protein [Verrucomicrobiota bacterium]
MFTGLAFAEPQEEGGVKVKAKATLYYIAAVQRTDEGTGQSIWFTNLNGERTRYWMEGDDFKRAKMEAVATGKNKDGEWKSAYLASNGEWMELPPGSMGMGNRMNPLVPWVHVAADQSKHPFGSMVYCEELVGHETVDGTMLDGYFWVGDVGGLIKGETRFDVFVGSQEYYEKAMTRKVQNEVSHEVDLVVYPLPKAPEGMDSSGMPGVRAILEGLGYTLGENEWSDDSIEEALIDFQEKHPRIPAAEYGNRRGATTQWFLVKAALQLAAEEGEP